MNGPFTTLFISAASGDESIKYCLVNYFNDFSKVSFTKETVQLVQSSPFMSIHVNEGIILLARKIGCCSLFLLVLALVNSLLNLGFSVDSLVISVWHRSYKRSEYNRLFRGNVHSFQLIYGKYIIGLLRDL